MSEQPAKPRFKLSQDWMATIIGLVLVAIIGAGLVGPGPHRLTITAEPGETVSAEADTLDGWTVNVETGTGDDARTVLDGVSLDMDDATDLTYICDGGELASTTPDATASGDGVTLVTVANNCDQPVTVRLSIDAFIVWPLFGVFE